MRARFAAGCAGRRGPRNGSPSSTVDLRLYQGIKMAHLIEELRSQARALPPADRVRLAEELLATVHEPDGDVEAAWDEEIRNRIAEIDAGTANLIPAEEVFAEVRRLLR